MIEEFCEMSVIDTERLEAESCFSVQKGSQLRPWHSYESLDLLLCSEQSEHGNNENEKNKEICNMVKFNNTLKKLVTRIRDPFERHNFLCICSLLTELIKYNGPNGFYLIHLPYIGEVLEFLCTHSNCKEYLCFLYSFLKLCGKIPRLVKNSEILSYRSNLQRHFSLLGYLLILVPDQIAFFEIKCAIECLILNEDKKTKRNSVKPIICLEALESSKLLITLAELLRVACNETYPLILSIFLSVINSSLICCLKALELGIINHILIRIHPTYRNGFGCDPIADELDLLLDSEDYYTILKLSVQILWRLMNLPLALENVRAALRNLKSPSIFAMWGLRGALRREVLRTERSMKSRGLRNYLVSLILLSLLNRNEITPWELENSGLVEDLGLLCAATECGTKNTWAQCVVFKTRHLEELYFKRTLLMIVSLLVEISPKSIEILKHKMVVSSIIQLINPNITAGKMLWDEFQISYLFEYATNALSYLAPKLPEEFIQGEGSLSNGKDIKELSCTDKKCSWKKEYKTALQKYNPAPLMQHECFRAPVKKIKLFKNNPTINKATSTNEPAESATVSNKSAVKSSTIAKSFPITPLTDLEISAMNEIIFNENPNCATTLHHFGRHEPITQVKKKVLSSEERRCIEILFNHQHSDFLDEIVKFELGSNPLQECCENSLNELQGDFVSICEKSKLNYSVWHKERKFRITGSVCYGIFTYTKNKSPDWVKKCEQLISPKNFKSQFTEDGKLQEKHALKAYKDSTKERVEEFGLICSRQIPWLAYSPDGIIFKNDLPVALIEIKCPFIGERCWYQRHH